MSSNGSRDSQAQLRLAVEAAHVGTWDYNLRTGDLHWDERCREIFGLPAGEPIDYQRFIAGVHPEDRAGTEAEVERAVRERGIFDATYRVMRPDGDIRWISARGRVLGEDRMIGAVVDITPQKTVEEALRASEARTRALVEGAGVGIVLLDLTGRPLTVNAALCDFLGYTPEELASLTPAHITHPDDLAADVALFQELIAGTRQQYTIEKRYIHKTGATIWARLTVSLVRQPTAEYAVAVVEDITERRKAAEELRRAHERYALAARATNDVIWDWDAAAATIVWNDALRTMFGYDPDAIDNRLVWWETHLHPDDRERVVASINHAIASGASSWNDEYRFERADGSYVDVHDRGYIARAADGTPMRMIGAMLDVTERKRAERAAAFMAEASEALASSLDAESTLRRVADLAVPVLADECSVEIYTDESQPREAHVSESKIVVPLAAPNAAAMGAMTLTMSRSHRAFDQRDLELAEDLARRAAIAIEHARLYAAAQEANRAKDEFLATLSHELRTPLTAILGWAGLLGDPTLDPDTRRLGLETIHRSAVAQARLVDDVLDLSRVIAGKMRLEVQNVSMAAVVRAAVDAVRLAAAAKEIRVVVAESGGGEVIGDANRLQQVVWNLLANAIKFTPPGGMVELRVEPAPSTIRLIVSDTGSGIAPDFLPYVFEPFRQADAASTRIHGGLGLGLAIVRYIVEAHGGTVTALSDGHGRGARFVCEFPRVAERVASPVAGSTSADLSGVRVLFVDDQEDARELAQVILSRAGADASTVSCVSEALDEVARETPDVVVTDIAMPVADGYTLLRELRSSDPRILTIAATACGSPEDREKALAAGFDAFIRKPMQAETLTGTIAAVLRRPA